VNFPALGEFVRHLESSGELKRIAAEVDPQLELTEIAARAVREQKPALLFENVKGSKHPVAMNVYASERRIELALGRNPGDIGEELAGFAEQAIPPTASILWNNRSIIRRFMKAKARSVGSGSSQEFIVPPDLNTLPIQKCWPGDGGRFITQGEVFTYDPVTSRRNVGLYRMHVYDGKATGMHWQIQKGGGFHYRSAEQRGRGLEVAVALGTDPALMLASVAALPEGIDEVAFASFLRGKKIPMTRGRSIGIDVPAHAEFILEGIVPPIERRMEGPFGDHFGHYSNAAPFPVFHLRTITSRRNPIYPAAVVGIPPMEDKYLGDATQQILGPLVRMLNKEIRNVWAYYEAGFHNLLVAAVDVRYRKEAVKAAMGILGSGQLSLTKCLVLVSADVDPRDWNAVLRALRDNFESRSDFILIPNTSMDTLDFTSLRMELGSKMIIDATRKQDPKVAAKRHSSRSRLSHLRTTEKRIVDYSAFEECLLVVKVRSGGRAVVERLVKQKELSHFRIIAAVSEDVDIHNRENLIWGIFTRFDCERDIVFAERRTAGISCVVGGVMGIDATWKKGYPEPLTMDPSIIKRVDEKWEQLWK
jgi:UbiD family decarboxylase